MTTTSKLILLASSLLGVALSTLLMTSLQPLMRLIYKTPHFIRSNLLQILPMLGVALIFAFVWAGSHFLNRDFGISKNVGCLCLALSCIVPSTVFAFRVNLESDRKKREAKNRTSLELDRKRREAASRKRF